MDESGTPAFPAVLIDFASSDQANRRVAGLSVAGRLVQLCAGAGFSRIGIALADGGRLGMAAASDVERLAQAGGVVIGERETLTAQLTTGLGDLVLLDAHWLVSVDAFAAFARSHGDVLRHRDAILARRAGAGLGNGTARGMELTGEDPIVLDHPNADRQILRRCGKPLDGLVSRTINRPVSRWITRQLLHILGIRPMHATAGTALLAALMFLALLSPAGWALIAGGLLYQAASVFDGVDGEMARATFRSSRLGAAADSLIDMATNLLFVVGITVQAARGGWMMPAYAGMLALVIIPLGLALIGAKALADGGPLTFDLLKAQIGQDPTVGGARLARLAVIVTSRDFYALYFSAMAVCGLTAAILFPLAIAALIWITVMLLVVVRPDEKVEI